MSFSIKWFVFGALFWGGLALVLNAAFSLGFPFPAAFGGGVAVGIVYALLWMQWERLKPGREPFDD